MSTYVDKPLSLIEKKKLQWAKEREELAGLCGPWSSPNEAQTQSFERPFQRNRYVTKLAMTNNNEYYRKDYNLPNRRSSLPPLYKNQFNSIDRDERGGETSGYGSDNQNHLNENLPQTPWNQSGYESSSSYKDDRPKWRDKNHLWESTKENEPPNWVKRGLQNDEEIHVSNTSPAESPQQDPEGEHDRPSTGCSSLHRTYIRGQNVPLDSIELAERERRRQIALAHQEAIRQQLADRERRRREEKEKRIKEELEEELRIEREQEIERQRREQELRAIKEKQDKEQKRKEAIEEALEIAEREAKMEKMKLRMSRQNIAEEIEKHNINNSNNNNNKDMIELNYIEKKSNLDQSINIMPSPRPEAQPVVLNNEINNNLDFKPKKNVNEERALTPISVPENISNHNNINNNTNNNNNNNNNNNDNKIPASFQILSTPRTDNLAIVLQTPLEALQNMQYAVLMSNLGSAPNTAIPIAIPLTVSTDRGSTSRTENRILTPTQYRNKNKRFCDSSTQTEYNDFVNKTETSSESSNPKFIKDKNSNVDSYDSRSSRKERGNRSGDRSVEERPKWGANRPPTRYLKQSEKDPLYQRRKLRQKMREVKVYDYKNSSDESQTGSPRTYRKKNYVEKRHTRALWRKNDHFFSRNIRMYHTEIVPLESDKEQIYYSHKCCCRCSCSNHHEDNSKVDILKIEHNSPREERLDHLPHCSDNLENAEYILDKISSIHTGLMMKQEQWERSPRTPSLSSSTRNTENN